MKNKKRILAVLGALAVYLLLMTLLVYVEKAGSDPSIKNIGDAIWFSLVTLTTVGYGDMSPVTLPGRLIGIGLVLCSLGLLSFIFTGVISFLTGKGIPLFKLKHLSGHTWNVFTADNNAARTLAERLREEDPECVNIFLNRGDEGTIHTSGTASFETSLPVNEIINLKKDQGPDSVRLFCFAEDSRENYLRALELEKTCADTDTVHIYCRSDIRNDRMHTKLTLFNDTDSIGRSYWASCPLRKEEKNILIIGMRETGTALSVRALLTNIFQPDRSLHYIFCGDSRAFRSLHYVLFDEKNREENGYRLPAEPYDHVQFADDFYALTAEEIAACDRIIICEDSDETNLDILERLKNHFVCNGKIYIRLSVDAATDHLEGVQVFGTDKEIFTPEMVMQDRRNKLAWTLNEDYRKANPSGKKWEELTEFKRQSNIAAADHLAVKAGILLEDEEIENNLTEPALFAAAYQKFLLMADDEKKLDILRHIEHNRWVRFHQLYNWTYGPRDDAKRRHDRLVPYEKLPAEIAVYNDSDWRLLGSLHEE